jgi:type VI secretion system protein ImpF
VERGVEPEELGLLESVVVMAELSLRERLQPALLDRLVDEERLLTIYTLSFERARLVRLGILEGDLRGVLISQGLTSVPGARSGVNGTGDLLELRFSAPSGRVSISQINGLLLKPPGAPEGVSLERLCEIEARNVLNESAETAEQRFAAGRRLREIVSRDLAFLLNASSLEATDDLDALPYVRSSVVNFGMPSLAGRAASSVSADQLARRIEGVIRNFEPRLTKVRVSHDPQSEQAQDPEMSFRIEAQLWSQPAPHQVVLHTRINTESGEVRINDPGSR